VKDYPTIERIVQTGVFWAFDKLDGSNIRAEWNQKRGFYKFGKRTGLLDDTNLILKRAPDLIIATAADKLDHLFRDRKWERVVAFFEFHGPRSFAGQHEPDDEHVVSLIDVSVHRKGILVPNQFMELVNDADVPHAAMLHHGSIDAEFIRQVKDGTLKGMTFEGVVCKGGLVSPGLPLMFKLKSDAWIAKLRSRCGENDVLFQWLL
jgi:hypothetical protein